MVDQKLQDYFTFKEEKESLFNVQPFVPLKASVPGKNDKKIDCLGYREDLFYLSSILLPIGEKERMLNLGCDAMRGGIDFYSYYIGEDGTYSPADQIRGVGEFSMEVCGVLPVLDQYIDFSYVWHLNQDIVIALKLFKKNGYWIAPEDDYAEIARIKLDANTREPSILSIKNDYLKDYLCAKKMGLYINIYRSRMMVVNIDEKEILDLKQDYVQEEGENYRWQCEKSYIGSEKGTLIKFWGELWKSDWVDPATKSHYVRGDKREDLIFCYDAGGAEASIDKLIFEIRYLWFKPECILTLLDTKASSLKWYTKDTGHVECSPGKRVKFGIHESGYINVYAREIGLLPHWQQKIWHGFNVTPGNGLAKELYEINYGDKWLKTTSPEKSLEGAHERLEATFKETFGFSFFDKEIKDINKLKKIHRFRSTSPDGLYELAKDITRYFIEHINKKLMWEELNEKNSILVESLSKEKTITILNTFLKHNLENNSQQIEEAIKGLRGINEVRLFDAHDKSEGKANKILSEASIRLNVHPVHQGYDLLLNYLATIENLAEMIEILATQKSR